VGDTPVEEDNLVEDSLEGDSLEGDSLAEDILVVDIPVEEDILVVGNLEGDILVEEDILGVGSPVVGIQMADPASAEADLVEDNQRIQMADPASAEEAFAEVVVAQLLAHMLGVARFLHRGVARGDKLHRDRQQFQPLLLIYIIKYKK